VRSQNDAKRLWVSAYLSLSPSACPHGTNRFPPDRFSWNLIIFQKSVKKIHVSLTFPRVTINVHEYQYTTLIIYHSVLLRMRNVSDTFLAKIKINILSTITFSRKLCSLWDNVKKYDTARQATDDNIIGRMRVAFWVTKATNTRSEFVIVLAFLQQQSLYARAPMSYYMCIACLVIYNLDYFF
jgi:hypothetical protein